MEIKGRSLIDELRMLQGVEPMQPKQAEGGAGGKRSFGDFFAESVEQMNQLGLEVDRKIQGHIEGTNESPHEAIVAIQKADVSFRLMLQVKDQLEQAYQQIMRTQI